MAIATPTLAQLEAQVADIIAQPPQLSGFYRSLDAVFAARFVEPDELLAGLHRGEVAFLVSDEAQSKTRLLMQMALGLAGGQAALPWSPKDHTPRSIFYVNGDAAASRLRDELKEMMPHMVNTNAAQKNFRILADARINRQPLNLYRDSHWHLFTLFLKKQKTDLVILDGMREPLTLTGRSSAAAQLQLLRNARQLATDFNCAVIIATTSTSRHRLTGTARAQVADTIYQLQSDHRRGGDYRQWRCWQSRWALPEALDLHPDEAGRGYRLCEAELQASIYQSSPAKVTDVVKEHKPSRWEQLLQPFADHVPAWQLDKRDLANYAPEAETVADELIKNITNADDYTSEKFVAPPLGSVLAITQLQSESGATNSTDATIDYGTKVRAERDRKQGKKRHSKKMRRYR
jgi:hypothetical protein